MPKKLLTRSYRGEIGMKNKVKKYVDNLFSDIYDTQQLRELKEEVSANLLEKVNDFVLNGFSEEEAFNKGIANLGDMSELVEGLKEASKGVEEEMFKHQPMDKKHVIGYVVASAILLFGAMTSGIVYLQDKVLLATVGTLMPFLVVSVALFVYLGLTQESSHEYGMNPKRAIIYSLATSGLLFGVLTAGIVYFNGNELFEVLATLMPFALPSILVFIYLGLTEKSRMKMDSHWQKQWIKHYSNPHTMVLRGNISGALWIFSFAAFLLIGFTVGWKYSLIVFVVAIGCEVSIEAFFAARRNK